MKWNAMAWLITGCLIAGSAPAHSVEAQKASDESLLSCDIPIETAQSNLQDKGYQVERPNPGRLIAHYKTSEKDSSRRMLGSFDVKKERQYVLEATGPARIRFVPSVRETQFATGVMNSRHDVTREYLVTASPATQQMLEDMRKEVCGALVAKPSASEAKMPIDVLQYLIDQCRAGDVRACQLVNVR